MNEVNNISRSFADNVNYLAELDKQYYTDGFIKRNGIQLGTQEYFGKVTMNVFDKSQKKHIVSDIISGSIVGNSGLEQFFLDMKTSIETLYNDVVINVVVSNGTGAIADKNINITLSSTDTILGLIQVDISMYIAPGIVADYTKYSILSASNEYIAILPYLSTLDNDFNNSILSIGELSDEIKIVSDNSAGITSVANTVVPNINEILLVDTRAIEAANSATSANESMIVANASRDSAISSAMLAEASRIAAELSESNSKASELSSLSYKDIALSSSVSANESKTIAISKALEASSSATSADTSSVSASLSANIASDKANEAISSAVSASQKAIEANASANIATSKASEATNSSNESLSNSLIAISKASEASASALEAINARDEILGMEVATGSPGSEVIWDGNTLTIPAGFDGDSITNVTSNKVLDTTTVTISGTFANSPYSFNIEDGVDGIGDMNKSVYDTNNSGVVDNAEKVNGLTVETAVPAGALFTDTIVDAYTKTESDASLNSKQDTLITGENIKSVNNTSLLGSGNLEITVGSGGYSANVYLTTLISSTVSAYNQISYTPEPTQTILSSTVNNNEVLMADYIFDGDVSATAIPAGEWAFHFHRRVSNTHGTSFIRFEIFKRSSTGDETVLFSHLSHSIENIVFEQESILVTQPIFTVTETDRIGIKLYASTTRDSDTVIDIAIGDGIAAYFTTPLEIRHNQLRARDAADAHPISSISGLQAALDTKLTKVTSTANRVVKFIDVDGNVADSNLVSNSGGDLGLGVSPSIWHASVRALETASGALFNQNGTALRMIQNGYYSVGSVYSRKDTAPATLYSQENGEHKWATAVSATAGTSITFVERMKLDNTGVLTVGGVAVATATDIGDINSALDTINGQVI